MRSLAMKLGVTVRRNVNNMNAFFGGPMVAIASDIVWVMNIVPDKKKLWSDRKSVV